MSDDPRCARRWDVEGTDHWSIEPFQEGDMKGALLEESSFATVRVAPLALSVSSWSERADPVLCPHAQLFAKYRETYLREIWGHVEAALKKHVRRQCPHLLYFM